MLAFFAVSIHAQSGGGYEIRRSTLDAGGGHSDADALALAGTAGQPDAHYSEGDAYAVRGGFWGADGNVPIDVIFADGFE